MQFTELDGRVPLVRRSALLSAALAALVVLLSVTSRGADYTVQEDEKEIRIETPQLGAAVRKKGYVSGVQNQSFLDKKTGFRDPGFGLDIVDWIMEPGSDEAYRDQLGSELVYRANNAYHGSHAKRSIEGPQICTQARELQPEVVRGQAFVAVRQSFTYRTAAPGKKIGSTWTQWLVFPVGKRYFLSMDRIDAVNSSDGMFLRIDLPGHVKHNRGDTFEEIYLSYLGGPDGQHVPAAEFLQDFPPDPKFNYCRGVQPLPQRFFRAIRLRDPQSGRQGPWLAGMTLEPSVVYEAWCHQRGYVCLIEEFGGRPVRAGGSFSAAFVVGYFDSLAEMQEVYDKYRGTIGLHVTADGFQLLKAKP